MCEQGGGIDDSSENEYKNKGTMVRQRQCIWWKPSVRSDDEISPNDPYISARRHFSTQRISARGWRKGEFAVRVGCSGMARSIILEFECGAVG
jgi:hypothetical protein